MKHTLYTTLAACLLMQATQVTHAQSHRMEIPHVTTDAMVREHTGYTLQYDINTHCPRWVAWQLTAAEAESTVAQRSNDFQPDPTIPLRHRVEPATYKHSGYDRGHMCPAGDMKWSPRAMSDCFLMSNICPQAPVLNQRWWEHLESACRRWASREGSIYICCGPIYSSNRQPTYLGTSAPRVRVPDGYFKVILSLQKGHEKAIGFLYRNTDERQTMQDAATTVDEVERCTGLDFFPNLPDELETRIETQCNLRVWN